MEDRDELRRIAEVEAWRTSLEFPVPREAKHTSSFLAQVETLIETHASRLLPSTSVELVASVYDFITHLTQTALGTYYLRNTSLVSICSDGFPKRSRMEWPTLLTTEIKKWVDAFVGDQKSNVMVAHLSLAMILAGLVRKDDEKVWEQDFCIGPMAEAVDAWKASTDFYWVRELPDAPWLRCDDVLRRHDGASTCCVDHDNTNTTRNWNEGVPFRVDAHLRGGKWPMEEHLVEISASAHAPWYAYRSVALLKDSARVIAPHAGHSKAHCQRGVYTRNFIFIDRDLAHCDGQATVSVASTLGGSVSHAKLMKLLMPTYLGDPTEGAVDDDYIPPEDARHSSLLAEQCGYPGNVIDYFFKGPWETDNEMFLVLLSEYVDKGRASIDNPSSWNRPFFNQTLVLAVLRTDNSDHPATIFMSDNLARGACKGAEAARSFAVEAFMKNTLFLAHCARWSKPPAVYVARL